MKSKQGNKIRYHDSYKKKLRFFFSSSLFNYVVTWNFWEEQSQQLTVKNNKIKEARRALVLWNDKPDSKENLFPFLSKMKTKKRKMFDTHLKKERKEDSHIHTKKSVTNENKGKYIYRTRWVLSLNTRKCVLKWNKSRSHTHTHTTTHQRWKICFVACTRIAYTCGVCVSCGLFSFLTCLQYFIVFQYVYLKGIFSHTQIQAPLQRMYIKCA